MPTVYLWRSGPRTAEHAAMKTDKYYISLWPEQFVLTTNPDVRSKVMKYIAHPSGLVFGLEFDVMIQGDQSYDEELPILNVTDEAVNKWYEEMLTHNDIKPEDVTLDEARKVVEEWNENTEHEYEQIGGKYEYYYRHLSKRPSLTLYGFYGHLIWHKPSTKWWWHKFGLAPFYNYPNSSVTLLYNLIETADINYPILPIETKTKLYAPIYRWVYHYLFTVEKFKEIINKHYQGVRAPPQMPNTWYNWITSHIW